MPGMAASPAIFENLKLDPTVFILHYLKWHVPRPNDTLADYAKMVNESIIHDNPVLIGVSFGGMLVQEMARHRRFKKVIIISSIKSKFEMPKRMHFARYTRIHKLLPTGLVNNVELLAKYAFGEKVNKRLALYEIYLDVRDKVYIDWAIHQIVNWKQTQPPKNVIHIHGELDNVFPINNIKGCITVNKGKHTMIIYRAKWFNEHLPKLILE
ncbi:alpha/beta hydrolase [Croceivirga radicis]|uniref:Alpha/beta hydrolase n=1 Tax=Croceivirga radicis TaxID=1929488 RepID=A0A1V6LTH3_9FLAO|nr:alpha/beta hydrolase [Croceivirga radicis]OQD43472.1 alpha/beta hydrolase [Croceivirga radicis]